MRGFDFLSLALKKGEDFEKTETVEKSQCYPPRGYLKYDDKLSFSRESSLALSSISYPPNQLSHISIQKGMEAIPVDISLGKYGAPEERFCPAHV